MTVFCCNSPALASLQCLLAPKAVWLQFPFASSRVLSLLVHVIAQFAAPLASKYLTPGVVGVLPMKTVSEAARQPMFKRPLSVWVVHRNGHKCVSILYYLLLE